MLTRAEVERFAAALAGLDAAVDDAERIALLSALESVKGAVAAAQARVSVELWASRVAADAARGVPLEHRGDGVAEEIALARHESPSRGATHLGLARALVLDLPQTMAHLAAGRISEWAATMVHQATVVLEPGDRRTVDARLAADLPCCRTRRRARLPGEPLMWSTPRVRSVGCALRWPNGGDHAAGPRLYGPR